jgi:hypothetical protein
MATSDHKGAPSALEQAINTQRARLVSAHAVQQCLYEALLYADGEDAVMYAEVANVVAALLGDVLDKLDAVQLRTAISGEHEGGEVVEDAP